MLAPWSEFSMNVDRALSFRPPDTYTEFSGDTRSVSIFKLPEGDKSVQDALPWALGDD